MLKPTIDKLMDVRIKSEAVRKKTKLAILSAVAINGDVALEVSRVVSDALQKKPGSENSGRQVTDLSIVVASGAIDGAIRAGCNLEWAGRGVVLGVLNGTLLIGSEVVDAISRTAGIVISAVVKSGGDLQSTSTGLVRGAIQGATKMGIDAPQAAAAAAAGALNAAGDVRSTAYQTIFAAITKQIDGITVEPREPAVTLN